MTKVLASFAVVSVLSFAGPLWALQIGPERLDDLPRADVTILGEVHDNPGHHDNQARAVAALAPVALVFEMLTPDQAERATVEARSRAAALAEALDWDDVGWADFAHYYPIFTAAPLAGIYGGALPVNDVRRSITEGAAAVFGAEAARYGLDQPLAEVEQTAREAEQMAAHCDALPVSALPGMVAAQRLRDAALARAVVRAVAETGGPVVVITGTGHANKVRGIPAALALAAPDLSVLSVGQVESDPGPDAPFDLWLVTGVAERDDPCAIFR